MHKKSSTYIVNPYYDWLFIIGSPTILFIAAVLISNTWITDGRMYPYLHNDKVHSSFIQLITGTALSAHFVITFIRSHANPAIFKLHPLRFWLIPILLLAGMLLSNWFLAIVAVIAAFWDMWHSSQQTFGFGRIYDMKAGNPPLTGRKIDMVMNLILWAGPLLGGASLLIEAITLQTEFNINSDLIFTNIPAYAMDYQPVILWVILSFSLPFTAYYINFYYKLSKQGYKISFKKVYLIASTGLLSIYSWGFNSFGIAFFIMNFFHVVQYFAIMWHTEKPNLLKITHLNNIRYGKFILLISFFSIPLYLGFLMEITDITNLQIYALFLSVSILHYWYDGFMWSVRLKQV